jgi:2-hydroxy-6-oxonona-2,4-dienedioate hydrolase
VAIITAQLDPSGLRYDYARPERADAWVVLLPGLFAGEWMWDPTSTRLRDEGFGVLRLLDPLAVFDWSAGGLDELRVGVRAVLDAHSVERATLCGNSLGGLVALDFARHHGDRVELLVVSGAPGLEPEVNLEIGTPRRAPHELVARLAERLFHDPARVTEDMIRRSTALLSERRHVANIVRALKAARAYRVQDVLPEVRCRVLLLWGESDRVTPAAYWDPWARMQENLELRTIPECGHSPMIERPDVFNELLLDFLRRPRRRAELEAS